MKSIRLSSTIESKFRSLFNYSLHLNKQNFQYSRFRNFQRNPKQSFKIYTSTEGTNTRTLPNDPSEYIRSRARVLPKLINEISQIIQDTGFTGINRTISASRAIFELMQEYITIYTQSSSNNTTLSFDPPERVLRKLFEKLGATYIKFGQFIASSPTLFPEAYVVEFQKCLDATNPIPFNIIKRRIENELKDKLDNVFEYVNEIPIASASIAQVHSAILKQSSKPVVIKVLKPGVEDILNADINFVYIATKILEFINPRLTSLSLSAVLSDLRHTISEEVDFKKEALHISHFSDYLNKSGMNKYATCPYVYNNLSTQKILIMEKLEGSALIDLESIRNITKKDPEIVLINALNTWFGSLMMAETFHADVHAGNLLVLNDGRVGFIDFGIVGRISPVIWNAVESFLVSINKEDFSMMAKSLATMGATSDTVDLNELENDLKSLFKELSNIDSQLVITVAGQQGANVAAEMLASDDDINNLIIKLARIGERHGTRFPREFYLLVKQMLYFDRYTKILAPTLQVMNDERVTFGKNIKL